MCCGHQLLQLPLEFTLRELRMEKTGHWPSIVKVLIKEMILVTTASSHTKKSAKSINLRCLVFFNQQQSFDAPTTGFLFVLPF